MVNHKIFTAKDQLPLIFDTLDIEYNISISKKTEKLEIYQIILLNNDKFDLPESKKIIVEIEKTKNAYIFFNNIKKNLDHIDCTYKKENRELYKKFLLDKPSKWEIMYKSIFYDVIPKTLGYKNKRSPAMASFMNKFVYAALGMDDPNVPRNEYGKLLKELQNKNSNRKVRHHQFLNQEGRKALKRHINILIELANNSNTKEEFYSKIKEKFNIPL